MAVAVPAMRFSACPIWVVPLKNVMVPVGVPEPEDGFTMADKVTPVVAPISIVEGATWTVVAVADFPADTTRR